MTDDEAFVRAVVDRPGDDTPRLVYADWLDDRGDPRGAYLRAETAWAKPWQTGYPPGWGPREPGRGLPQWADDHWLGLDGITSAARGLDPLWVARVSRPPVGVCCDHVRFSQGPHLTPAHIERAEAPYGRSFHDEYRAFLLNYNGGRPSRWQLIIRSPNEEGCWDRQAIDSFACVRAAAGPGPRPSVVHWLDVLRDELEYVETELGGFDVPHVAADYVPIGKVHSSTILLMRVGNPLSRGVFSLFMEGSDGPQPFTHTLPELLARIVTDPI